MAAYRTEPLPDAPYSVAFLADLHAGVLSESVSERLWPLVRQDESAMAVISALNGVSDRLAEVGRDHTVGEPMPPEVAERIDRSLAAADAARDTPSPLLALRSRRHPHTVPRLGRGAGIGIAATIVAAIAVTAAVMTSSTDTPDSVVAGEPPPAPAAPLWSSIRMRSTHPSPTRSWLIAVRFLCSSRVCWRTVWRPTESAERAPCSGRLR